MSNKSNNVAVRIAYMQTGNNRKAFDQELALLADINGVLEHHKELTDHKDHVKPNITHTDEGAYGCTITLNFPIRHNGVKQYQYSRLHFVLQELGRVLKEHEGNFTRLESYLDNNGMVEPWALVVGPAQVLLREGAAQWNATGIDIPGYDSKFNAPLNGLTVMGEPTAVDRFRRMWQYYSRSHAARIAKEREGMIAAGAQTGAKMNIAHMMREHPSIQWQHLLIWVHTQTEAGGQWFVTNLDEQDQWVLAGVRYVNINMKNMMEEQLPFTKSMWSMESNDMRFFKRMEYATFETSEETVYDGTAPITITDPVDVVAEATTLEFRKAEVVE
jgi:hypothetical protein